MLESLIQKIAGAIPGTAKNLALRKRRFERDMRAAGHSRKDSARLAAEHYKSPCKENPDVAQ